MSVRSERSTLGEVIDSRDTGVGVCQRDGQLVLVGVCDGVVAWSHQISADEAERLADVIRHQVRIARGAEAS